MAAAKQPDCHGFGFCPQATAHHFLVTIPAGNREVEGKLRVLLPRAKWDAIADEVRVEFNKRLKQEGLKGDPALIPAALKNWLGLVPEERWWLYTMTCAATGHALQGRNKGWRKAVRYALTENPVSDAPHEPLPVFELSIAGGRPGPARPPAKPRTTRAPRRPKADQHPTG